MYLFKDTVRGVSVRSVFLFVALICVGVATGATIVRAGNSQNVIGWLWGGSEMEDTNGDVPPNVGVMDGNESGFGWISMNSRDCDTNGDGIVKTDDAAPVGCPSGAILNYGVNVDVTTGNVSGRAWSENYGWISFEESELTGCPNNRCAAFVNKSYRLTSDGSTITALDGWARILSIPEGGTNAGGWAGWIRLSTNTSFALGMHYLALTDSGNGKYSFGRPGDLLSIYAWSDELGWIDFSRASITAPKTLKICQEGCASGVLVPSEFSLDKDGLPKTLYACLGTGTCYGDDVPVVATWTENSTSPYTDAITLTAGDDANNNPMATVTGKKLGKEGITATSGTDSATTVANVLCSGGGAPNCEPAETLKVCKGVFYNMPYTDFCGRPATQQCEGTRFCDFNYREVAP